MYIDLVGRQVLTHGTTWDEIDFGKCSVQPANIDFCEACKTYIRDSEIKNHRKMHEELIRIDSRCKNKKKKHIRHLAVVTGTTARTQCNRVIRNFWTADNVSYFYTDGSRYSSPCRTCLPKDYKQAAELELRRQCWIDTDGHD